MPTITITVAFTVKVENLEPETIGGVMCDVSGAIFNDCNAEIVTILEVKPNP